MSIGEFNELRISTLTKTLKEIKEDFEGEYIPDEDNDLLQSIIKLRKKLEDV